MAVLSLGGRSAGRERSEEWRADRGGHRGRRSCRGGRHHNQGVRWQVCGEGELRVGGVLVFGWGCQSRVEGVRGLDWAASSVLAGCGVRGAGEQGFRTCRRGDGMMPGQRCPLCEAGRKAEGDIGTVMRSISGADETGGKPLRHGSRRRRWEDQKLQGDGGRGPGGARSTDPQSGTRRRGQALRGQA